MCFACGWFFSVLAIKTDGGGDAAFTAADARMSARKAIDT
jgi:hypothetical protein